MTDDNYTAYAHPDCAIHQSFRHLSGVHKANYLRAYLLHHPGGGYHDIKFRRRHWAGHWEDFRDDNVWIESRRERRPEWIGYPVDLPEMKGIQREYRSLGTMGWAICRPNMPDTRDLVDAITQVLTTHAAALSRHSSRRASGHYSDRPFGHADEDGYPVRWLELMGEHSHLLMYKYRRHLRFGLPDVARRAHK